MISSNVKYDVVSISQEIRKTMMTLKDFLDTLKDGLSSHDHPINYASHEFRREALKLVPGPKSRQDEAKKTLGEVFEILAACWQQRQSGDSDLIEDSEITYEEMMEAAEKWWHEYATGGLKESIRRIVRGSIRLNESRRR